MYRQHYERVDFAGVRQRGAVLMTALVLLVVMTLLGVSAMKFANLDERMSVNATLQNRALRAAEGAVASAPSLVSGFGAALGTTTTTTATPAVGTGQTGTLEYAYWRASPSSGGGYSIPTMSFYHYNARAEGAVTSGGGTVARSEIGAGIRILGPGM